MSLTTESNFLLACMGDNLEALKKLSPSLEDIDTGFMASCLMGKYDFVEYFVSFYTPSATTINTVFSTCAAEPNRLKIMKLLAQKYEVDVSWENYLCFKHAYNSNQTDTLRYLVEDMHALNPKTLRFVKKSEPSDAKQWVMDWLTMQREKKVLEKMKKSTRSNSTFKV